MKSWRTNIHGYNLIAFIAVLGSIVILALAGSRTDLAIMTGLVGVLGSFKPWGATPADGQKVEVDQPANSPIPATVEDVKP